jgi:hypothetical protein
MKVEQAPSSVMESTVNFNHLLTDKEIKKSCRQKTYKLCKWKPVSEGQATAGRQVHFDMLCETCGCRTTKFMNFAEYDIHQKVITKEVNGG